MNNNNKIKLVSIVEATLGGIRKHLLDLLLNLDENKFEQTLIYSSNRADEIFKNSLPNLQSKGIKLIEINIVREINVGSDIKSFFEIRKLLKNINPDIIHLHAAKAGTIGRVAALSLGKKGIVYTPHGGSFHKFGERTGFIYKFIESALAFNHIHFIAVSNFARNQYKELLHISEKRNHLIYNGISLDQPKINSNDETRKEYNCAKEDLVVLIPAVFYEAKGHLELLTAFTNFNKTLNPNIKLLFAGDGPIKNEFENKVKNLGLSEQFISLGFIHDLTPLYTIADLILLPSQNEVFGYVLLEAMSFSKPIFATSVDAIPELVNHGENGELFSKTKLDLLFERLNYFLSHKDELVKLGENGYLKLSNNFSLNMMVKKTEELYFSVIDKN